MNRTPLTTRVLMLGITVLAMSVQGCQETPTEPVTVIIEELFSHLNIALASTTSASSTSQANVTPPGFISPPLDNQIEVLGPNTNIFQPSWPVILDLPITGRWSGDEMVLSWPDIFDRNVWPDLDVAGGTRYGNTWLIYFRNDNPNDPVAQHTEWIRRPGENTGTVFPLIEKLLAPEPCNMCPVAHLVAGPSRHTPDDPIYRRKTTRTWVLYGDQTPFTWPDAAPPGPPPGPPELTELHLFISGATVLLADGSTLTFEDQIGDIELFALNGNPHQIANSAVPQGEFTSVSFVVDPAQSWVRAGGQVAVLNFGDPTIAVQGPWTVGTGSFTTVTLTIDIDASMSWNEADGSWTFAPVIVLGVTTG